MLSHVMNSRQSLAFASVLVLSSLCVGKERPPSPSKSRVTVLVMRHCIRSTPGDGIVDVKGFEFFDNYSSTPWPAFGVPDYYCLPRGANIVKGTGKWLKRHGNLPMPVEVIADDVERDIATARALLSGMMQTDNTSFSIDSGPFNAAASCQQLSLEERERAVSSQRQSIPTPEPAYSKLLAQLAAILQAKGETASWNTTKCSFEKAGKDGYLDGSCSAASQFVERFLMEWGGGMEVAWNRLQFDEIPQLMLLHSWYRMVMDSVPEIVARSQASIVAALSAALADPGKNSDVTRIFVGHDTQLNALSGALGLTWNPDPFPVNATLPGSALRFDSDGSRVTMSYLFPANYSDDGDAMGSMMSVPAALVTSGKNEIQLREFHTLLEKGRIASCANNWTFHDDGADEYTDSRSSSVNGFVV